MNIALKYRDRVDPTIMLPQVNWREPRNDRRLSTTIDAGISVGAAQGGESRMPSGREKKRRSHHTRPATFIVAKATVCRSHLAIALSVSVSDRRLRCRKKLVVAEVVDDDES